MRHCPMWLCLAIACGDVETASDSRALPTGATITVTDCRDEFLDSPTGAFADGDCSIREAINAARGDRNTAALRDACTPGMGAGFRDVILVPACTSTLAGAAADDLNVSGDLDPAWYDIEIRGPATCNTAVPSTCWVLNANNVDRGIHFTDATVQHDDGVLNAIIRNGCAGGGPCNSGTQFGGGVYFNVGGTVLASNLLIENSRAGSGGSGIRTCAGDTTPASHNLTNVEVRGCSLSPAIQTHVDGPAWSNVNVHHNTVSVSGFGVVDIFSKDTTCTNCTIANNTNTGGDAAGLSVRGSSVLRAHWFMIGGTISGNTAHGSGAGVYLNGGCALTPSQSYGCYASFTNTTITGNTADSPVSAPAGSGGGIWISPIGPNLSRMELLGTTAVSGNSDLSTTAGYPVQNGPDCAGTVYRTGSASIGVTTGCTVNLMGPVCGNGTVESPEACDDGNTNNGDCCSSTCTFETGACTDSNACTPTDTCNGAGVCIGSGTTCGNGTLQTACGEVCDDGNLTDLDGCHSNCQPETCTGWSY